MTDPNPQSPTSANLPKNQQKNKKNNKNNKNNKKQRPKPPLRKPNQAVRGREYLTSSEVDQLRKAAKGVGRYGHRDDTLILLMFRHGLRVGEVTTLRWEQLDLEKGLYFVYRLKNGISCTHLLRGVELRALRRLKRESEACPYVFVSERKAPLTNRTVHHLVARAGQLAKLPFSIHPHMLRHSTGFYLANEGHDTRAIQSYLGHANINNTVRYTALSPKRFETFWRD